MKWFTMWVVSAWVLLSVVSVRAENNPATRLSLKDLGGIAIYVEPIGAKAQQDGLSMRAIRGAVESRLRKAEIAVLSPEQQQKLLRRPCLVVRLDTSKLSTGEYLYSIHVEVTQWVASLADPAVTVAQAIPVPATTWSAAGVFGITPSGELSRDAHRAVDNMVGEFIDAYYKANPSQTAFRLRRIGKLR